MSSLVNIDYLTDMKTVFETEINALLKLKESLGNNFSEAVQMLLECKGRVIVTGIGKSGLIGKKIVATLASTGTPSLFLHPAEGLHGDLGMVTKEDVVIAISNSGESEEVLRTLPSIKRIGAKVIALVGNEDSTLADKSNITLSYGKVDEACPLGLAPTTTTTLTLVIGDAIAVALLKARDFKPENFALYHPGGSLGKRLLLTVQDVAGESAVNPIAQAKDKVQDVLFKITETGLGAISVVDHAGKLIGILTDGDIRRQLSITNDILSKPVSEIFNPNPKTIQYNTLAAEALRLMEEYKINVVPVVNEDKEPLTMIHMQNLTKVGL
jgi:arabinose-5-phosphate isomerase